MVSSDPAVFGDRWVAVDVLRTLFLRQSLLQRFLQVRPPNTDFGGAEELVNAVPPVLCICCMVCLSLCGCERERERARCAHRAHRAHTSFLSMNLCTVIKFQSQLCVCEVLVPEELTKVPALAYFDHPCQFLACILRHKDGSRSKTANGQFKALAVCSMPAHNLKMTNH